MKTPMEFAGKWRIKETEAWAEDALDLVVPAHVTFEPDGLGHFQMIVVEGGLDCRFAGNRVEFSWIGDDDGHPASGRGWAEIANTGALAGRIYFHQGDDSSFVAYREPEPKATLVGHHRRVGRQRGIRQNRDDRPCGSHRRKS